MCVYYKKGQRIESNCFCLFYILQKTNIGLQLMLNPMSRLQYADVNCRNLHFVVFWLISDYGCSKSSLYCIKIILQRSLKERKTAQKQLNQSAILYYRLSLLLVWVFFLTGLIFMKYVSATALFKLICFLSISHI